MAELNEKELNEVNGGLISRTEDGKFGVYNDHTGKLIDVYSSKKDAVKMANCYNVSLLEVSQEQIKQLQEQGYYNN